ncbi:MAG: radical SAM protein [Nitrospira sp.]|nr:radical SAM protein [bacterium]MBL7048024.1 radical SAM protein [Nitrospira sp.]
MGNIYTNMKIFQFKEKIDSLTQSDARIMAPLHIRIKPTNVCSHKCSYCAYRSDRLQLGKDMFTGDYIPREKMMEIMDDVIEMGVKAVTFSGGGDPFYYPYLLETVKKLTGSPVRFASLTNGSGLHGEIAEVFAQHATWLRVSIDGWDDRSYSQYRQVPEGEFTRVMANMENFSKLDGKCFLGVSLVIDELNAPEVYGFIERLKGIGVNSVKVSPCIVSNDCAENDLYHEPFYKQVREQVDRAVTELKDENFEIYDSYHAMNDKFQKEYTWCPYLQILPIIGADQNIYSCQDKAYNLDEGLIGSIKDQRFKDFWFSDKNKFFNINPSMVCNHHCVSNIKNNIVLDYLNADPEHAGFV